MRALLVCCVLLAGCIPYSDGDHTASWFTLAEARTFVVPPDARDDTVLLWQRWLRYMEFVAADYVVVPEHVRVVFNFDS